MKEDFGELIQYLDDKFQKTATKEDLEGFATKKDLEQFATKEDLRGFSVNFVTLDEFDNFRAEVKEEFAAVRASINSLTNSVDKLVKAVSGLKTEYFAVSHQLSRHEKWIQKIAEKVGIELAY